MGSRRLEAGGRLWARGHDTAQSSQAILPHPPHRSTNGFPSRGLLSPYRSQLHAAFARRAEALRTCRAAQCPLRVLAGLARRCSCPALCCAAFSLSPMSAPGDRLEDRPWTLPNRNGFYSRPERGLPAIPVAQSPNQTAPPGSARCCWDVEAQRHRPHMPASIYTKTE